MMIMLMSKLKVMVAAVAAAAALATAPVTTQPSSLMETLTQGVSELEAQMDRRLTRLEHRAVAVVRRVASPFEPRMGYAMEVKMWDRLEEARDND